MATSLTRWIGKPSAFVVAIICTVLWIAWGVHFGFSDAMMSWMGAVTGIVSILVLVLLQNSQNHLGDQARRDTAALQLKLDELIRASADARNEIMRAEELSDEALEQQREVLVHLTEAAPPVLPDLPTPG